MIDLERSQVIDIFPGRDGEAVKEWLKANPQVEVITRDRWAAYAQAATEAAPEAKQVADRWHLLKNLQEALAPIAICSWAAAAPTFSAAAGGRTSWQAGSLTTRTSRWNQ